MKLEKVEGCICDGFYVDDNLVNECTNEELQDILMKAVEKLKSTNIEDNYALQDVLRAITMAIGKLEVSDDACECCGDFIYTYTLEI